MRGPRRPGAAAAAATAVPGLRRTAALLLTAVALLSLLPRPAPAVGQEPVVVRPAPEAAEALAVSPAVTVLAPGARDGTTVRHEVVLGAGANGETERTLDLAVRTVEAGPDGTPVVTDEVPAGVRLPADAVVLRPGETASITTVLSPDAPAVLALVASPRDDPDAGVTALVVRPAPAAGTTVEVAFTDGGAAATVLPPPDVDAPVVVDLRLRLARPFGGTVVDDVVRDLLVMPGAPRTRTLAVTPRGLPQHLRAVVDVADTADPAGAALDRAEASTWVGEPAPAVGLAAGAVGVTALAVGLALARGRRRGSGDGADAS